MIGKQKLEMTKFTSESRKTELEIVLLVASLNSTSSRANDNLSDIDAVVMETNKHVTKEISLFISWIL